jgi:hypothetical protein
MIECHLVKQMCGFDSFFRSYKPLNRSRKRKRPHDWAEYTVKVAHAPGSDSSSQTRERYIVTKHAS